jgi:hypothetical protein
MTGSFHGATFTRGAEPNASTAIRSSPCRPRLLRGHLTNDLGGSVRGNSALATGQKSGRCGLVLARYFSRF